MSFITKLWRNEEESLATPVSAEALIDLEERVTDYFDSEVTVITAAFNAKAYGAKGDGGTDDSTALQSALSAASAAGGGVVYVPAGVYLINTTLEIDNFVILQGAGAHTSILKLGNTKNVPVLKSKRYGAGGAGGGTEYTGYFDIGFNGNKAQNAASTESVVKLDGIRPVMERVYIYDGYINLSSIMSRTKSEGTNKSEDGMFKGLEIFGSTNTAWKQEGPHDSQIENVLVRVSGGIGIWSHGTADQWTNCHVYGNMTYGYHSLSGNLFKGCTSEGCTTADVWFVSTSNKWFGGWLFASGEADAKVGFLFGDATHEATGSLIDGVKIEGKLQGSFKFNEDAENSWISGSVYQASGELIKEGEAKPSSTIDWNVKVTGGATYGTVVEEGATMGKTLGKPNLLGPLLMNKNEARFTKRTAAPTGLGGTAQLYNIDPGYPGEKNAITAIMGSSSNPVTLAVGDTGIPAVASASTITIKDAGPSTAVEVTGTTEIKKIEGTHPNHLVTIKFGSAACTVANGENLKLKENFTSIGTTSTLTVICTGASWYEVGRTTPRFGLPGALAAKAEATETEASSTRNAIITGLVETATATRTKIKILVGAVIVTELVVSVAATGVSVVPFSFPIAVGQKWKWEKVEGTVEANGFKFSTTLV